MSNSARVLVVDDNVTVAEVLTVLLRQMGCEVLTESDGQQAIRTARQELPDLILLDMRLPGMDGLDVVREMRRHKELESTPIVGLTGYAGVIRSDTVLDAGCDAYFAKPFDLGELRSAIRELLPGKISPPKPRESEGRDE